MNVSYRKISAVGRIVDLISSSESQLQLSLYNSLNSLKEHHHISSRNLLEISQQEVRALIKQCSCPEENFGYEMGTVRAQEGLGPRAIHCIHALFRDFFISSLDQFSPGDFQQIFNRLDSYHQSYLAGFLSQYEIELNSEKEEIRKDLEKKERLVNEINHRVKNSFNIIESLLSLQCDEIHSVHQAQWALQSSKNRIHSLALIHDNVYPAYNSSTVDLKAYIGTLIEDLLDIHSNGKNIGTDIRLEDGSLNLSQAFPFGLIIIELVTNALKYGVSRQGEPALFIRFEKKDSSDYCLTIGDNGPGLPACIDPESSGTLGLKLVYILVSQLNGSVELDCSSGTRFTITFPRTG